MAKAPKKLAPGMMQGTTKGTVQIFCYSCKQYVEVPKKEATKTFKDAGHTNDRLAFLEPNVGRSKRRHTKAVRELAKRNKEKMKMKGVASDA